MPKRSWITDDMIHEIMRLGKFLGLPAMEELRRLAGYFQFSLVASNCSLLSESHSTVLEKLKKNQQKLNITITTLQEMESPVSPKILEQSEQLSAILGVLGEVEKCGPRIQMLTVGMQQLRTRNKGSGLIARLLLENGANANKQNTAGETALMSLVSGEALIRRVY
ncbi:Protein of unknown function [Pyronema omphalodes CBS 100304]|uniref:Uncharacterized protein n=1 Tax=Pyronema omphalodes (strain CBS 100304) TaxID=1076935 RepID=U4LVI9_PYROM|nr:Protein of unknown function [Pyronema omphalodes CBS 100304]